MPPHFRPSLGDGHLAQAALSAGRVRRSPLAVDQLEVAGHVTQSRLTNYMLRNPAGDTSLYATIDHELDDGGVLIEEYNVTRQRGDSRPVIFGGESYETNFAYIPPGRPDGLSMEPCGGAPELEPAIEVIGISNGALTGTILRQLRTQPAFAGSYPVPLQTTILILSDRPWQRFRATGFWAHTYSAQHHNWEEDTLVDFTRDVSWYESVYEPYLDGTVTTNEMPLRSRTRELNSWDANPRAEIEWLDLNSAGTRTETWNVVSGGFWRQVEAALLARQVTACANPQVLAFTDYELAHGLQLVTCPDSSALGFDLRQAVPFSFIEEPALLGTAIEGSDLVATTISGRPGYIINVGAHRVEISKGQDEYFFMSIKTAGGAEIGSFLTQPLDLHLFFDPAEGNELISGRGPNEVSARLLRRWAGQGVGESAIYAPVSFELSFGGQTYAVDTWDRLAYTNTHHNWMDELEARTDELTLFWSVRYESGPLVYRVRAVNTLSGQEVLPETIITLD